MRRTLRSPATLLLALLAMTAPAMVPASAQEHPALHYLELPADALEPCRGGLLVNLPPAWQPGDGAVALLAMDPRPEAPAATLRARLLQTLLAEHAAVLEIAPLRCDAAPGHALGGALDALHAMTRTMGGGMMVAIALGPGGRSILDVVRPLAGEAPGPAYAAALALGDGPPAYALGPAREAAEHAPARLGLLCRALAPLLGAEPGAARACIEGIARETRPPAGGLHAAARP